MNIDKFKEFLRKKGKSEAFINGFDNAMCKIGNLLSRKPRDHVGASDKIKSTIVRYEDRQK